MHTAGHRGSGGIDRSRARYDGAAMCSDAAWERLPDGIGGAGLGGNPRRLQRGGPALRLRTAASGDTILFKNPITVTTAGGGDLPAVVRDLTIEGGGFTLSGNTQNRGLFVYAGTVAVNDLTIVDTLAKGGDGGLGGGGAGLAGPCSCAMAPM